MAEAEGEWRGRLDAGHGGVGVRVQHGGEAEEEEREQAGRQEGDESRHVRRGHRSLSPPTASAQRWSQESRTAPFLRRVKNQLRPPCPSPTPNKLKLSWIR
jgi:hypothetical protein